MDKNQCKELVELLSVTWDKPLDNQTLLTRTKGYWEYIHDLPYDKTRQTIKNLALINPYLPKPGELRITTLALISGDQLPPEPEEAWNELQQINQQIRNGTNHYKVPHPALAATIKKLGNATQLNSYNDKQTFISIYTKTRNEHITTKYGTPDDNQ